MTAMAVENRDGAVEVIEHRDELIRGLNVRNDKFDGSVVGVKGTDGGRD